MIGHADILFAALEPGVDVVYSRWCRGEHEFPFTKYDRITHLLGLDYIGTDVLLSSDTLRPFAALRLKDFSVEDALRELARMGKEFKAVDRVTYERI